MRDQFQFSGIEGINLSVCFSAKPDYFSGVRSFAEPAVRFYNKCTLEPFSLEETTEFVGAVFGSASLDHQQLAEWLQRKTLDHPYFVAFISRELCSLYRTQQFTDAGQLWPVVSSRLEQGKFNADLAQLSEKEVALLRAVAHADQTEFTPGLFAQKFSHQYFKRLAKAGLLRELVGADTNSTTRSSGGSCDKQNEPEQLQTREPSAPGRSGKLAAASWRPCITHRAEAIPLTHSPLPIR